MTRATDGLGPDRRLVVAAFGVAQILGFGTSFYFPAVFATPIVADTGWSLGLVVSGTSIGLLVAGLISPQVGHLIDHHGARPVICASSLLNAAGLIAVGLAPNVAVYLIAWVVIGLAMGTGLYDAVFAALGQRYGREARGPITNLTLFGGFSSTICWPLSAFLIEHTGWRMACFIYAGLHILVALPLQYAVTGNRRIVPSATTTNDEVAPQPPTVSSKHERRIFLLVATILSLAAGIGSIVIVHFMIFLQSRGVAEAAAVTLGTLFGPAQVGARIIERLFGTRYHPIWTMVACCVLMAVSLALLFGHFAWLVVTILLYGAGYGISWVGRGTLPLALFGPVRFPRLMGKIAFPSLIVQALAPSAGALMIEHAGVDATIGLLTAFALINVVLIALLWTMCRAQLRTEP
ncbi:MFS transporter [Undibacter mobilis]|uniref:MFS transporter n=1 Tax=Undibacter mobilis TaxID=2292256 RepID=UPI001FE031DB|nr:MFS transporter [Undibacter mobilis]